MPTALQAIPAGVSRPDLGLVPGTRALVDEAMGPVTLRAAVAWLRASHEASKARVVVDLGDLERWVGRPVRAIEAALATPAAAAALGLLQQELEDDLVGRAVTVAELHGPVRTGRWWFTPEGAVATVDGDTARLSGLPPVDVILLLLARRRLLPGAAPGDELVELAAAGWSDAERAALDPGWSDDGLSQRTLVGLAWLQDAAEQLADSGTDSATVERALQRGLDALTAAPALAPAVGAPSIAPARPPEAPEVERAAAAVARAEARTRVWTDERTRNRRTVMGVAVGVGLWLAGVWHLDPGTMTDLGLVSILRPAAYVGLAVLIGCFAVALAGPPNTFRLATPLVALVAVLHGTPAVLYGTLRYSWAWKHLGVIDYIHRHGAIDPGISALGVYHNWPGFFALNSMIADLFGANSELQVARWWPVAANLAVIPALLFVFRGLRGGEDRRAGWAAVGFFVMANWIGQDYFSPQSLGFLLYLVVIGVVLHRFRNAPAARREDAGRWSPRWAMACVLVAGLAIVTSHQITPFVLMVSLAALTCTRQARTLWLTVAVVAMSVAWSLTGAWHFMRGNLSSLLSSVGSPVSNADGNLVDQARLSAPQVWVSTMGRVTVVLIVLAALAGVAVDLRRRKVDRAALVLLITPATLVFANSFGGEIGFRTYLFALPMLSWYAARLLWARPKAERPRRRPILPWRVDLSAAWRAGLTALLSMGLLAGFLFAYYGKDRWYRFSPDEVAATDLVFAQAPNHSLLVTLTADYPGPAKNYERLVYVPVVQEPYASRHAVLDHPADVLQGWLSSPRYAGGYVLLTRAQEREMEALGPLAPGSARRVRQALDASGKFRRIYTSADAAVYVLASPPKR